MYNTGDFAFDTVAGANVQILERIEMWGYTSYKVFNPSTGRVYKCIGIAVDYYQTGEEVVLMARIGDGGYSNGLLYIPVGNFMVDFEEIGK